MRMTNYAPPTIPAFPAGYGPLPADMDGWIQSTLGFCTNLVVFRAERHAAEACTAGFNTIEFDTVLEDPFSGWSTSTYSWLAPYTGWYEITVTAIVSTSSIDVGPSVLVDGTYRYQTAMVGTPAFPGGASAHYTVALTGSNDYVQGSTYTSATASLSATAGLYSSMEIVYISE
jgi:hypothetical protein